MESINYNYDFKIPHIYVIGDKSREPERVQYLESYFKELGLETIHYFQPTYKNTVTDSEIQQFTAIMPKHGRPLKLSEISVFLNFYYLFQHCVKTHVDGNSDYILILESDVIFEGNLKEYLESLSEFLKSTKPDCVSLGSGCGIIDHNVDVEDMSLQIARKYVVRCMDTLLFSYKGLQKLESYMKKWLADGNQFDEPIDNFFDTYIKGVGKEEFTYFWVWPSITLQGSQYGHYKSSIQCDPVQEHSIPYQ